MIADPVAATRAALEQAALAQNAWISPDNRVTATMAAQLLGVAPGTLSNWRSQLTGPAWCKIGGHGHRVTYRLTDLAVWIAERQQAA